MSNDTPETALAKLRSSAQRRLDAPRRGKTRIAVQVGHCSASVGAGAMADILISETQADRGYVVIAGCDGACFDAPQVIVTEPSGATSRFVRVTPGAARQIAGQAGQALARSEQPGDGFFAHQHRIALERCGEMDGASLDEYLLNEGYAGLARALSMTVEEVTAEVKASGLRGRGGAYFPAAIKWEGARKVEKSPRYLVVNCEEGEPGIFKDRHLMEGVAHRIIEGAVIAAYASDVHQAFVYINAEANLSAERMQAALEQASSEGLLGSDILGSGFDLDVEILRGAGGYVCGEETTMLNTIEGYRREPRLRPPFPTESGLLSRPTVINNAETLASIPFILANGSEAFIGVGTEDAPGTKIVSVSGSVERPGVVEVPMGTTLRRIIYDVGGGPAPQRTLTGIAVGGPSSGVFPPSMLDTPIGPGQLHESGVMLGAGGVIALDERIGVLETVRRLAAYNAAESCGKCTPCREGTPRMVDALDRLMSGRGSANDLEELRYLAEVVGIASLCGLGQAAGGPINSALHFFGDEMAMVAGVS